MVLHLAAFYSVFFIISELHFTQEKNGLELDFIQSCTYHNGASLPKQLLFYYSVSINQLSVLDDITVPR